ncbi:MAG: tetratricopeptide repeat protein [Clostridiales bacterium]|nr:tetratricopeptide repeat protein [Clostridiales bacterium]
MKFILILAAAVLLVTGIIKIVSVVLIMQGNKAYGAGNNEKALKFYKRAANMAMASMSSKIMYALMLMRSGQFAEAEHVLSEIILYGKAKMKPAELYSAKAYRCMAFEKQGRLDEALEDAREIFENCKNTLTYGMLGYLMQKNGGAELEFCLEAYDYNSDDRDICDNLLLAYLRSGDLDNAEKLAADLRNKYPDFAEAFYHSAQIALKRGDKALAAEYADKLAECHFTAMTTVSEKDIEDLREEIKNA